MPEKNHDQPVLGKLPVFFDLKDRLCILAGDNEDALPKARLLLSTGARIQVFMVQPKGLLSEFFTENSDRITVHNRPCRPEDLEQAALAIGAFADNTAAEDFAALAHSMRVPLNMVDRPALCDFQVPSIVNRTPLIVAISTAGIAPVIGQWLRGRIETLLPSDAGRILRVAASMRADVLKRLPKLQNRRRFWSRVAEDDLPHMSGSDDAVILKRLHERLNQVEQEGDLSGVVHRIITSGDPDHLRLSQLRALQNADLVISLDGADPVYIDYVRRDADRISGRDPDQALSKAMAAAGSGQTVIWLAGPGSGSQDLALETACADRNISYRNDA